MNGHQYASAVFDLGPELERVFQDLDLTKSGFLQILRELLDCDRGLLVRFFWRRSVRADLPRWSSV